MYVDFLWLFLDVFCSSRSYELRTQVFGIWGDLPSHNPENTACELALKEEDPEAASPEQNLSMVDVFLEVSDGVN